MVKRVLSLFLMAALLMISLSVPAMADAVLTDSYTLEARDVIFNRYTNTMGIRRPDATQYVLIDAVGNELTSEPYIGMVDNNDMFEVAVEEGTNIWGLIDGQGNPVMPMQYGDIEYVSTRWQVGIALEDATVDNYDYKSWSGDSFYLIAAYDVYFNGTKVGSLSRTEANYFYAYGSYLYVRDKEGNYAYYDSAFNKSDYASDGSGEYAEDYKTKTVWHKGSGQQAFTAGCTLTADDVEQSIWETDGQFYDLQGNLLFKAATAYDTVRAYQGDYAVVRVYGKYGLIDREGNEVVPCEYDEISCNEAYLASGYQIVVKDGKVGYVNAQGEVTCDFVYGSANASTYRSPFTSLKDLEGNVIVLSGAVGELPERYKSVSFTSGTDTCPVFAAVNLEGVAGVVDLVGNAVIPFDGTYDSEYDFDISNDGSLVVGYQGSRMYQVYLLQHTSEISAVQSGEEEQPSSDEPESWICTECGTENTGKFCTECGAAKPETSAALVCKNCGYTPAEGETPKFCPECGTAFEY